MHEVENEGVPVSLYFNGNREMELVQVRTYRPVTDDNVLDGVLIYIHGGGFVVGDIAT